MSISLGDIAVHFIGEMSGFDRELDASEGRAQSWASHVGGILGGALSVFTGNLLTQGFNALTSGLAGAAADAEETARVQGQLNAVLASTRGISGQTVESVNALAQSIEQQTRISAEAAVAGQSMLLTFTNIGGEVFPRATQTLLDMATAMNQGATPSAEQLSQQAIQLGKALNDPVAGVSALSRVGVTFTDAQKKQIETMVEAGNVAGAQALILRELETEFGGSAAAAEAAAGGFEAARDVFDDFFQAITDRLLPGVNELFATFARSDAAEGIRNLGSLIGDYLAGALSWLTDVGIPALIGGWNQIAPAVNAALDVLNSVGDVLSAVASYAYTWGSDLVAQYASGIGAGMSWVVDALQAIGDTVTSWLQPNSPPKILPEIDRWGLDAARLYMQGWADPSLFESVKSFGSTLGAMLQNLAGGENTSGVASALFGSRAAYADAVNELQATGQVSAATFARIGAEAGEAGEEVQRLAGQYLALEAATLKANQAQTALAATNGEVEAAETALLNAELRGGDIAGAQRVLDEAKARRDAAEQAQSQARQDQANQQKKVTAEEQAIQFQREQLNLLRQMVDAQDRLAKASAAKKPKESEAEKEAKAARKAQEDYEYSLLSTSQKIDALKAKQAQLGPGQREYWELAGQIRNLEAQAAREAEANAKKEEAAAEKVKKEQEALADAQWAHAFAVADTATKLEMMRDKLSGLNPEQTEYWETLTQISRLEDQLEREREARDKKAKGRKAKGGGGGGIKPINYAKPARPAGPSDAMLNKADEAGALPEAPQAGIGAIVSNIQASIQQALATIVPSFLQGLAGQAAQLMETGLEFARQIIGGFLQGVPGFLDTARTLVMAFLQGWTDAAPGYYTWLAGFVTRLLDTLWAALPGIVEAAGRFVAALTDWTIQAIPIAVHGLGGVIAAILGWIGENGPAIGAKLGEWALAFVAWVVPTTARLILTLGGLFGEMLIWLVDRIPELNTKLGEWALAFLNWIPEKVIPSLLSTLDSLSAIMFPWLNETAAGITQNLGTWVAAFLDWVGLGPNSVVAKLPTELGKIATSITSWINGKITSVKTEVAKIGQAMSEGVGEGFAGNFEALKNKVWGGVQEVINWVKRQLGIGSPSKFMADMIGAPMAQGVGVGFEGEGNPLQASMQQTIMGAVNGLSLPTFSPALAGAGSLSGGIAGLVVNGPLIGSATIRSEQDITDLALQLVEEIRRQQGNQ